MGNLVLLEQLFSAFCVPTEGGCSAGRGWGDKWLLCVPRPFPRGSAALSEGVTSTYLPAVPCWKSEAVPLTLAFPDCRVGAFLLHGPCFLCGVDLLFVPWNRAAQ